MYTLCNSPWFQLLHSCSVLGQLKYTFIHESASSPITLTAYLKKIKGEQTCNYLNLLKQLAFPLISENFTGTTMCLEKYEIINHLSLFKTLHTYDSFDLSSYTLSWLPATFCGQNKKWMELQITFLERLWEISFSKKQLFWKILYVNPLSNHRDWGFEVLSWAVIVWA